jgi:guanylate kinase
MSGNLYIIAAPSGAGKSSLVAALLADDRSARLSVSYTTRAPRTGETEGKDYHFVSRETFDSMREFGEFLESAEVYGNLYGTSKRWIDDALASRQDVVLEIDWQGARQVKAIFPDAISIFVLPPSIEALKARLESRGKDSAEVIQRRLDAAREDMSHAGEFDYVIINNNFNEAVRDLLSIVRAQRLTRARQFAAHEELINKLSR